jgi:hypothetical protein
MMADEPKTRTTLDATAPGRIGAYLAALAGVALGLLGGYLLATGSDLPGALSVSLVLIGVAQVVCALHAIRRVRVAWSFGLSINGTAFVIFLFGAPKLRDAAEVSIALALVPAVLFAVITTLFALSADDY